MMTKDHPRDFSRGKTISITVGAPMHPTGEDPVAETAELHRVMSLDAGRGDPRPTPRPSSPPGSWWLPRRYGGSAPTLEEAAVLDAEEKADRAAKRAARSRGQQPKPS